MQLALYTFGQFIEPSEHTQNDGFHNLNDAVLRSFEEAPGFVARSGYASDPGPESWGPEIYPRFWQDNGDGWAPVTLSLWQDLNSAKTATYSGIHIDALKQGRKWFQKGNWPPYVLWWIPRAAQPVWAEGAAKLEALWDHGPTQDAFTFKQAFDPHSQNTGDKNAAIT
ncbi:MAG: hypothetical protein ACI861_001633 [Paracoccaceae bacterium]|jgi:hypothetical protein